jgi:hypothetical protein
VTESQGPAAYVLGTPREHEARCFDADPGTPSPQVSRCDSSMVDVDSRLMGLGSCRSRCPEAGVLSATSPLAAAPCALSNAPNCRAFLATSHPRHTNPPCTLRGVGINRWEALCRNPQERALLPRELAATNYRLVVKDNHRPMLPQPLDPESALPPRSTPVTEWRACEDAFFDALRGVPWPAGMSAPAPMPSHAHWAPFDCERGKN